jgi:hypothetical protein
MRIRVYPDMGQVLGSRVAFIAISSGAPDKEQMQGKAIA